MSVNLTLAFDRHRLNGALLAHERIGLNWQDYDLFKLIAAEATPITEGVDWYEDEGIKRRFTDPYGDMLTYVTAHALGRHLSGVRLAGWDAAVLAFINALPPDTRVVLWWH